MILAQTWIVQTVTCFSVPFI